MATTATSNKNQWFKSFICFETINRKVIGLVVIIRSLITSLLGKEVSEFDIQMGRALKAIQGVGMELDEIDSRFANFIDWKALSNFRTEDELIVLNKRRYKGTMENDLTLELQDIAKSYTILWRALDTLRIYFIYSDNEDIKEGIKRNQLILEKRLKLIHPKALMNTLRHGSYCDHSIGFLMNSELIEKFITKSVEGER